MNTRERLRSLGPLLLRNALDIALALLGLCLMAPALVYPFGRDQGLYHYVGHGWFHGLLPYRDAMEQKTPLIYLLFGLADLLFGERESSFRVLEVAWVLVFGWTLGYLATRSGKAPAPGLRGAGVLLVVALYFGLYNFWDTAQCEVWAAGLTLCALAVVDRSGPARRPAFVAGVLSGLAVLGKLPVLVAVPIVGAAVAERALLHGPDSRRRVRLAAENVAAFAAGGLLTAAVTVGYFAAAGGFTDFYDILVKLNLGPYRTNEAIVHSRAEEYAVISAWIAERSPLVPALVALPFAGLVLSAAGRSWASARRYLAAIGLMAGAIVGIVGQAKFCSYHWGLFSVMLAPAALYLADDAARVLTRRASPRAAFVPALAVLAAVGGLYFATPKVRAEGPRWFAVAGARLLGRTPREEFLREIGIPGYDLAAQREVGEWIAAHTRPGEPVAMRNFEPAMYLHAHRHSPTRFFWTAWIAWDSRVYRREDWLAQDAAQRARNPPRYMVTVQRFDAGAESAEQYQPEYAVVHRVRDFEIIERTPRALDRGTGVFTWDGRPMRVVRDLGAFDDPAAGMPGWTATGEAFATPVTRGAAATQQRVSGYLGAALVNSFSARGGDAAQGEAVSAPFVASAGQWLAFSVGGGRSGVGVELLDGDTVLEQWSGANSETLRTEMLSLDQYAGRTLRLRVYDRSSGGWGHVLFDHARVLER